MNGPLPRPTAEIFPTEYTREHPNTSKVLIMQGQVIGIFANPTLAAETERFLSNLPKKEIRET